MPVLHNTTTNDISLAKYFLGDICPMERLEGDDFSNKFKISAIFEMLSWGDSRNVPKTMTFK
jgi:hypothetical protein